MAIATNIVIADAATTPVNHTFAPNGKTDGVFWFVDRSQANAVGYWRISVETRQPAPPKVGEDASNRVYRVKVQLHEPVLANITNSTVSGVAPSPQVAYIPRSFVEYVIPERTAQIDRDNLWKMTHLLAANSQIENLVKTLDTLS